MEGPKAKITDARFFALETRVRNHEEEVNAAYREMSQMFTMYAKAVDSVQTDLYTNHERLGQVEHALRAIQGTDTSCGSVAALEDEDGK